MINFFELESLETHKNTPLTNQLQMFLSNKCKLQIINTIKRDLCVCFLLICRAILCFMEGLADQVNNYFSLFLLYKCDIKNICIIKLIGALVL